jgi:hypothetical protein
LSRRSSSLALRFNALKVLLCTTHEPPAFDGLEESEGGQNAAQVVDAPEEALQVSVGDDRLLVADAPEPHLWQAPPD